MKTIKEINKEIGRLRGKYSNGRDYIKDREITAAIQELEWVKADSDEITNRRLILFGKYNKLTRYQKMAFNALRKYEYKIGKFVTLEQIKSPDFIYEPDLVGFGEACLKEVLKSPELFLFEV